jgi:hypothetical protein
MNDSLTAVDRGNPAHVVAMCWSDLNTAVLGAEKMRLRRFEMSRANLPVCAASQIEPILFSSPFREGPSILLVFQS